MRFEHRLFEPRKLERISEDSKRYYLTEGGGKYQSVTTALGYFSKKGIAAWKKRVGEDKANSISRRAANLGTAMHNVCEDYVSNVEDWKSNHSICALDRFSLIKPYLDKHCTKIYGIELPLYSETLQTAGTGDLVCEYRGAPTVLDFKTSSKPKKKDWIYSYFIQCTAYGIMMEELYDFDVEQIVILMSVEDGSAIEFIEPISTWKPITRRFFRLFSEGRLSH